MHRKWNSVRSREVTILSTILPLKFAPVLLTLRQGEKPVICLSRGQVMEGAEASSMSSVPSLCTQILHSFREMRYFRPCISVELNACMSLLYQVVRSSLSSSTPIVHTFRYLRGSNTGQPRCRHHLKGRDFGAIAGLETCWCGTGGDYSHGGSVGKISHRLNPPHPWRIRYLLLSVNIEHSVTPQPHPRYY